mgnify:CR=1 FL=1
MRYLVNMKYDGTNFYGFQIQEDVRTIEKEVTLVLSKILNEEVKIVGCSRTDKGVHANDLYFHFDTSKEIDTNKLKYSLNSMLTDEIYIKDISKVEDDFHARYSVKEKEYVYIINTGTYEPTKRNIEFQYNKEIDIELIKEASKKLIGEKDFKSFTSDNEKENTIRNVKDIRIEKINDKVYIYIVANGFLKYMVRNIVGLLLDINEGKKKVEEIENIILSKDRTKLGLCVSPVGLYLNKVNY